MEEINVLKWHQISLINKILICVMVVACYLFKPMILGANGTPVGIIAILFVAIIFFQRKNNIKFKRKDLSIIVSVIIYYSYCLIQSMILYDVNRNTVISIGLLKALFSILIVVTIFSVILIDTNIKYYFFKIFIGLLCVWVASYCITLIISLFYPVFSLLIYKTLISGYGYNLTIYFPFTPIAGSLLVGGFRVLRLSGFLRECGIAQLFYIWAMFQAKTYFKFYKVVFILCFIGTIFCFSTAGYINLFIIFIVYILFNFKKGYYRKSIFALVVLIFLWIGFTHIDGIGFEDKNIASTAPRLASITVITEEFLKSPFFGVGVSKLYFMETGTFYQQIYKIGLIGVILYFNIYMMAFIHTKSKKRYILSVLPILITLLFSQPINDSPLLFLLLLNGYDDCYKFTA